jgi:tetratricopeptide (TPR) repeat protein
VNATQQSASRDEAANQRFRFNEARRAYEEALAADMDQAAVRVRLGRVLWRLGEREEAAAALAGAIDDARDAPRIRYLAHLFLGRVQEDGGRLDEAESSYRRALELDPQAQAAGIALAHVLRLAGDEQAAREVAVRTVSYAGRRGGLDFFWEYLTGSVTPEKLLGDLRAKVRR